MAPDWVTLLLSLSSLLQAPAYKLPALQRGGQDETVQGLAADGDSQPVSQGRFVWDAAEARAAGVPVFLRGKREAEMQSANHAAEKTPTDDPNTFTIALLEHTEGETDPTSFPELLDESVSPDTLDEEYTDTTDPLLDAISNSTSTETTSVPAANRVSTLAMEAAPTQSTSNISSKVVANWTEDITTGSTESWEDSFSARLVNVTVLGETSPTSPPKTLRESTDIFTEPPTKGSATSRPGLITVGETTSSCLTPRAGSSIIAKNHLQTVSDHTDILVGKCLLAIFILALVAGIFIICTTVLGTLLWRQKRACQTHQSNATEMVCISALLPDSEPVANGGKPSKVKRMKMPMDNGSETDIDNLTLSSFLPDH